MRNLYPALKTRTHVNAVFSCLGLTTHRVASSNLISLNAGGLSMVPPEFQPSEFPPDSTPGCMTFDVRPYMRALMQPLYNAPQREYAANAWAPALDRIYSIDQHPTLHREQLKREWDCWNRNVSQYLPNYYSSFPGIKQFDWMRMAIEQRLKLDEILREIEAAETWYEKHLKALQLVNFPYMMDRSSLFPDWQYDRNVHLGGLPSPHLTMPYARDLPNRNPQAFRDRDVAMPHALPAIEPVLYPRFVIPGRATTADVHTQTDNKTQDNCTQVVPHKLAPGGPLYRPASTSQGNQTRVAVAPTHFIPTDSYCNVVMEFINVAFMWNIMVKLSHDNRALNADEVRRLLEMCTLPHALELKDVQDYHFLDPVIQQRLLTVSYCTSR